MKDNALVAELVYAYGLGPYSERIGGSNPPEGTTSLIVITMSFAARSTNKIPSLGIFICARSRGDLNGERVGKPILAKAENNLLISA